MTVSAWLDGSTRGYPHVFAFLTNQRLDAALAKSFSLRRSEVTMNEYRTVFEMSMPIRWGDMDAFGHVNNTVYFRYMEQVRISWFEHLGMIGTGKAQGPVIVNASMDFLRQLHYPGDVIGRMSVGKPGRSSFDTGFELTRADDPGTVYARGAARCVWIDYAAGRSVPIPEPLRVVLDRWALEKAD
jgi:acyl-CoA thioester hydrolase